MARGGTRIGAGRKPGGRNKRSREIADRAASEGITPLEVILVAMREHYAAKRYDQAAGIAKDAAPYMHPRLAAVEHTGADGAPLIPESSSDIAAALLSVLGRAKSEG